MSFRTTFIVAAALTTAASSWVYAFKTQTAPQSFIQNIDRNMSRLLFFGDRTIEGQFHICHGSPIWKEAYGEQVSKRDAIPDGSRFRMGNNYWTTFESTHDLTIGGTELKAGAYCLAFEKSGPSVNLVAYDAADIRSKKIVSAQPPQQGGVVLPMTMETTDDIEESLYCEILSDKETGSIELEVLWGPYRLATPIVPKFES